MNGIIWIIAYTFCCIALGYLVGHTKATHEYVEKLKAHNDELEKIRDGYERLNRRRMF